MKKAILAVSYGTAYTDALSASVEATENTFRTSFPDHAVRRAFTGKRIIEMLAKKGIHVESVDEALAHLADEGYEEVVVQPTHIIGGNEYESITATVENWRDRIPNIKVGTPLLHSREDIEMLCKFFAGTYGSAADAVVLMGHGSDHAANSLYAEFGETCRTLGYNRLLIATLEASPSIDDIIPQLKADGVQSVVITPLLFVAGGHACRDMAGGEPGSWKSRLEAEGFTVTAVVKGLGEYDAIRRLYAEHLRYTLAT